MGAPDTPGWGAEAATLDEVLRLADDSPNPSCASPMAGGVPGAVQGKERRGKLAVEEARARASLEKGGDARGTPARVRFQYPARTEEKTEVPLGLTSPQFRRQGSLGEEYHTSTVSPGRKGPRDLLQDNFGLDHKRWVLTPEHRLELEDAQHGAGGRIYLDEDSDEENLLAESMMALMNPDMNSIGILASLGAESEDYVTLARKSHQTKVVLQKRVARQAFQAWVEVVDTAKVTRAAMQKCMKMWMGGSLLKAFTQWRDTTARNRETRRWREKYFYRPFDKVFTLPYHTMYLLACSTHQRWFIKRAKKKGSKVICRNNWGWPVHRAAWTGDAKIVKHLLDMGADPFALDGRGATALMYACNSPRSNPDVVKLILSHRKATANFSGGKVMHAVKLVGNYVI